MAEEQAAATAPEAVSTGPGDPKRALYDKMVSDKLYSKSFDDFSSQFSTAEKVDRLHDFLTQKGKYDKGADTFSQQFFPEVKKKMPDRSSNGSSSGVSQSGLRSALSPVYDSPAPAPVPTTAATGQSAPVAPVQDKPLTAADIPGSNALVPEVTGQQGVQAPVMDVGDTRVVAQQAANEYQAEVQKKNDQQVTNMKAMLDDFEKTNPFSVKKLKAQLDDPGSEYYQQKEAEAKKNPGLPADQQIIGTLANMQTGAVKGIGAMGTGLVTAANYLAHTIVPDDVLQGASGPDATGRDQFDKAKDNVNAYIRGVFDNATINLSDKSAEKVNKNPLSNAMTQVASFAPAAAAAGGTAGLSFFFQGYGDADKTVKELKDKGAVISPQAENSYGLGMASLNMALMNMVNAHTIFSKFPGALRTSIVGSLSADAMKALADKAGTATAEDVMKSMIAPAMTFNQRVGQLGIDAVKGYAHTAVDLSAFTLADAALKEAVNKENEAGGGKELFQQNSGTIINQLKDVFTSAAPAFAAFGVGRSLADNPGLLFHNSPYTNVVVDRLYKDSSPENVQAIQRDLGAIGKSKGWSTEEINNTQSTVATLGDIAKVLPQNMQPHKFQVGVELVLGQKQLQQHLAEAQQERSQLHPAAAGTPTPWEDLLSAKIDQADDKLNYLVSGNRWTYFRAEDKYFKSQTGKDPMEISRTRYELENLENGTKRLNDGSIVMPEGSTDKKGNPIPPPTAGPQDSAKPVTKTDISDDEYNDFLNNDRVPKEEIDRIGMKVRDKQPLSEREKAVFAGKTTAINKSISDSLLPAENAKPSESKPAAAPVPEKPAPAEPAPKKEPVKAADEPAGDTPEGFGPIVSEKRNGINYDGRTISVDPTTREKLPYGEGFAFGDVSKDSFRSTGLRDILKEKLEKHGVIYTLTGASNDVLQSAKKLLGTDVTAKEFKIGGNTYTALIYNKENAKPESPEAVTPSTPENGKEQTKAETKAQSGQKGLAEEDVSGQRQDEKLLKGEKNGGPDNAPGFSHEGEADRHWVENETDPEQLAARYHQDNGDLSHTADYKEHLIHSAIGAGKINLSDYKEHGDLNNLKGDAALARRMDKTNSQQPIDTLAQSISHPGVEITPEDIINFIHKYPKSGDFTEGNQTDLQKQIAARYRDLTGNELTDKRAADVFNKQLTAKQDAIVDDQAREIIEKEGITSANIDKLKGNFNGFPYTPEEFDHVKRYLDEQEKTQPAERTGDNAPAQPGTKSQGVGGDEPSPATGNGKPAGTGSGSTSTGSAGRKPVERTPTTFDTPGDSPQEAVIKSTIDEAEKIDTEGSGKVSRSVKDRLSDEKKKRFDELRRKIKSGIRSELNDQGAPGEQYSGFNHELYSSGIELTTMYFDAGVTKFAEYAQEMINDMGPDVVPYLESFYEGAKRLPGMKGDFDSSNTVEYTVGKLTAVDQTPPERSFVDAMKAEITAGNKLNILAIEGIADRAGMPADTRVGLQEYVEQALVELAREITDNPMLDNSEKLAEMVDLYHRQPSLLQRSSTKVTLQQYSTPLPYAFAAGSYVDGIGPDRVYDPTAGTGMLTVAFDPKIVLANELDRTRFKILQDLGINSTNEDALTKLTPKVQGIVVNPPFGPSSTAMSFNGYTFNKLDHIIPAQALKEMLNAGRAAIIVGGHNEYDAHGSLVGSDFKFFNYLYHHYNVTDVINVDGSLYAKQGTSFPTRLILVNGRKEIPQGYAPVYDAMFHTEREAPVKTFEDLFNRVQERTNNDEKPSVLQSAVDVRPAAGDPVHVPGSREIQPKNSAGSGTVPAGPAGEPAGRSVQGTRTGDEPARGQTQPGPISDKPAVDSPGDHPDGQLADVPDSLAKFAEGAERGSVGPEGVGEFVPTDRPAGGIRATANELVHNDKVAYIPASRLTAAGSVIPSSMAYETEQNLRDIEQLYGPIDTFVANELGYADLDDLNRSFFSEQVDALGLAIHQLKQGKGMIVGDMTGIGKGRIAAGLIRYAVQQGHVPTFFTENADLFSDIYRDLYGIGSGHLVPFIVNDPSSDRDANVKVGDRVVYRAGTIKNKRLAFESKKLPHGTKVILSTYSQINSEKNVLKRGFLSHHTRDGFIFMDESHNVAGDSNSGRYFQDLLKEAKGVVFLSATYAKRADNMPVYAQKTSISDANMTNEALVDAILSGGNALQEIVASQLVKAGQMIRRERDFTGVENKMTVIGHDADGKLNDVGKRHRELADQVIDVCNAIIDFEKTHVLPEMARLQAELRQRGQKMSQTKSKQLSVANTPFASKMFNVVNQMIFSIKAPDLAHEAIRELKENNRKPVIAFSSTMESFIKNAGFHSGDTVHDTSFSASLMNGLNNTLKYRIEHPDGTKTVDRFELSDLAPEAIDTWNEITDMIKSASSDMSISPIDTMTEILEKAGLKVGEITGRKSRLRFSEDGKTATVENRDKEDTDKGGIVHDFNNGGGGGKADVILLNTAGSTGISMHADKSFRDQRQRVMIGGQFELDINKEVQKRGRIDRSNQVVRGAYNNMTSTIPAETRFAMMMNDKLKKLSSNAAGDQKSKANETEVTDFLNEYGDRVITDYLMEHPAIYEQIFQGDDPAGIRGKEKGKTVPAVEGIARKTSGRAALLKVADQEKFYEEVSQSYNDYIDYLNSTDQNNLAVKSVNLEAKVISKGTFIEGKHTQSPFGQDSILEKVEANVLRKPLTKEELEEAIERNLQGKTPREASRDLITDLNAHVNEKIKAAREHYMSRFEKQDEKDRKKYRDNPELYKVARAQNQEATNTAINAMAEDARTESGKMEALFRDFEAGSEHQVPSSMSGEHTTYTKGLFLGFSFKEKYAVNPFAPSNVLMKFAVLDGKRTITVSASRSEFISAMYAGKAQMSPGELQRSGRLRSEWDSIVKNTKAKETRYIVTGNILQAFKPNLGQLISYSTDQGHIEKGILMPQGFNPASEGKMTTAAGMYDKILALKPGEDLVSSDGNVTLSMIANRSTPIIRVAVPKTTAKGGRYFKHEGILDMVEYGEFETFGGHMVAKLPSYRLMDFLKLLDKDFNTKFNSGVEMQRVDGSDESDSDQATGRPADVSLSSPRPSRDPNLVPSKSTERIQADNFVPQKGIKKLPDIIADLAKGLNVQFFYARSKRSNAAGSYNASTGGVKLSTVGNLDVAVHEAGHALDDAYDIFNRIPATQNHTILGELQWFADRGGSNPPRAASAAQQQEYIKREGIAEFVRAYAINRGMAFTKAPAFFAHFETVVPREALDVLTEFGDDYLRYRNSTPLESIMANIEEVPKEQRSGYRKFVDWLYGDKEGRFQMTPWDKIQVRMSNSGHGFEKSYAYMLELTGKEVDSILPDENARYLVRLFAGVDAKVGSMFDNGLVTGKNEPIIDKRSGQRMNMAWLYNAFDTTSEETLRHDQALAIGYLFAERTIEKGIQFGRKNDISGIANAGDANDYDMAVDFLHKEFGQNIPRAQKIRIMEGARRYQLWADKMMRYMVDKGRMSETAYREIKEKNLNYVAFLPVQENQPGIENSFDNVSALTKAANMGNVKTVIREMTGSTNYKRHPYISLMQNTAAMVKEADRNAVLQSYVEPMMNAVRSMGEGAVNPFANVMMEVSKTEAVQGKPVLTVFVEGLPHYYMFSSDAHDVYDFVKGLSGMPQLPGFVTALPRMLRWTATHSPIFAKNHFIRSTFNRMIVSRSGGRLGDLVMNQIDGEKELYKLYGGSQNGYWLGNRIDYYKLQNQTIKDIATKGGIVLNPVEWAKSFGRFYDHILHASDQINRTAEFRSAYKKAKLPKAEGGLGFDEHNALTYAAYQAKDILNASVAGTWMRVVNQIIPFSNVEVQGIKRNIKAATEGDWKGLGLYAMRLGLRILLPTLFIRMLAKMGDYEEEYDNLPAYQRDLGWNFKVPGQEGWIYIPKPYDVGLLASGMDRAIGAGGGAENAWEGYDKTVYQSLLLMKPEMVGGPLAAAVEPMTNYSFFKQGPIVPRYEEDKILSLRKRYNEASRLGKGISWAASPLYKEGDSIDPRYIDNMMQTMFSYYGDWGMSLSDIGSVESRHKFGWKSTGFIKDQQIYGDVRVEKFYNLAKELGMTESRPVKGLSGMIRDYYNATDPKERKAQHDEIMTTAKEIYKEWLDDNIYKEKIESRGQQINFN